MSGYISQKGSLGLVKEATWGVNPGGITRGLAFTDEDFKLEIGVSPIEEIKGNMALGRASQGYEKMTGKIGFPLEIGGNLTGGIGEFLQGIFGVDVVTGATDPYTHTFDLDNNPEPNSYTIYIDRHASRFAYTGFRVDNVKLSIKGDADTIPIEVSGTAKGEETPTSATLALSTEPLLVPVNVELKIDAVVQPHYESIDIEISRDYEVTKGLDKTKYISNLVSKNFRGKVSIGGLYLTSTERDKYRNATSMNVEVLIERAGPPIRSLQILMPAVRIDSFSGPNVKGSDLVRASLTGIPLFSGTHSIRAALKNAKSTAY